MAAVAILGAGNVGRALGSRLLNAGVEVRFGVRDPAAVAAKLTGLLVDAARLTPAAAAAGADVIFLAVPAAAAIDVARSVGDLTGRILVDCSNPLRWDGGPIWTPPARGSVAQELAAAFPGARVIKGFNHFGAEVHGDPALASGPADAFFAGDDGGAKSSVMELAARMGFVPRDAGPLRNAPLLEALAILWIQLATVGGVGRNFAFRVERQRSAPG